MSWKSITFAAALAVAHVCTFADSYEPSHSCSKPYKPYTFSDQWQVDSFKDDVERYKRCIKNFVEEQKNAVEVHQRAANTAIEEWNRYVRRELN